MGGLDYGELASSTTIFNLAKWFNDELPQLLIKEEFFLEIQTSIIKLVKEVNKRLVDYGQENKLKLGTTMSTLLIIDDLYIIFHIGDSRIYKLKDRSLTKLTEDQTFIARELQRGNITEEEAKVHPKRNTLLECIGITGNTNMIIKKGKVEKDDIFLICSDGFYNKLSNDEIIKSFSLVNDKKYISDISIKLINLIKSRKESDNISLIVTKVS